MAIKAALYGLLAGSALVFGALVGLELRISRRVLAIVMAFGAGVLISTVAFELVEEAYSIGGFDSSTTGFILGALLFIAGDYAVNRQGGHLRKDTLNRRYAAREPEASLGAGDSGLAIFIGALLDGIPESAAIGIGLLAGKGVSLVVFLAVFLSNFPEGMSGSISMRRAGRSKISIIALWGAMAIVSSLSALFGYLVLAHSPADVIALSLAIAGGAVLAMVSSTMIPEAFDDEGRLPPIATPLATVIGFLLASILSAMKN